MHYLLPTYALGNMCLAHRKISTPKSIWIHYKSQEYAWNAGCKLQKNHNSKILSSGSVVDIRKWLRRWGVDELLELLGNVMQYVIIEERLMESLRKKSEDAKRTKLEYYIANINPQCWSQYKARMPIDRI